MKKKNGKGIKVFLTIVIILAICVLGFSAYKLLGINASYQEANNLYEDVGTLFEARSDAAGEMKQETETTRAEQPGMGSIFSAKNKQAAETTKAASESTKTPEDKMEDAAAKVLESDAANNQPAFPAAEPETRLPEENANAAEPETPQPEYSNIRLNYDGSVYVEPSGEEPVTKPNTPTRYASLQWDYQKLLSICEDGVGYIYQEGTPVSYPIVQAEDNDKYLRHMINGEYNVAGSIFVDCNFPEGLESRYSFIYGHNMDDKSMFGSITAYKNEEYYQEHPEFEIYVGDDCYVYYVFSAFQAAIDDFIFTFDFESDADFVEKMQEVREKCPYETNAPKIKKNSVVTFLSTCIDYPRDYNYRFVVFLIRGEKLRNDGTNRISLSAYPWKLYQQDSPAFLSMLNKIERKRYWDLFISPQGYGLYEQNSKEIRPLIPDYRKE